MRVLTTKRYGDAQLKSNANKDVTIILLISMVFASLYLIFEGSIMAYGRDATNLILLRFLPVLSIQFGMSCLGVIIVLLKNSGKLIDYGFIKPNLLASVIGCMVFGIPTVLFLLFTKGIHGFLPFQGMFLTKEILTMPFPVNLLLYSTIAVVWGFGEGLFYVVLADKINAIHSPKGIWNLGALVGALIAIAIHGMIGFDLHTVIEALTTFLLMYGSLMIREKTGNSWGNILIYFVIWNALSIPIFSPMPTTQPHD